jgi:hypothetical protein
MSTSRKSAVAAGAFFLITEIAAIAGLVLYQPVLTDANYIVGAGADSRVLLGGFFEVILVLAVIGTGVTLYPVVKRQNHGVALGYVCARLLEAAVIAVGIISVLSVVTLRRDLAGTADADRTSLVVVGKSLIAVHDWTFLLGPNFVLGANSLLLAYLMYRSRLVPRFIAVLGLVGGPLICASAIAVLFGLYDQLSAWGSIAALPVFAWEVSLAVYLIVKGFKPYPITTRTIPSIQLHPALSAA